MTFIEDISDEITVQFNIFFTVGPETFSKHDNLFKSKFCSGK